MNKQEMLRAVADKSGMTIKDTGVFYEAFVSVIEESLKKQEKVALVGFGTFSSKKREERTAINPRTKQQVTVSSCVVPTLKFGKSFKEALNK